MLNIKLEIGIKMSEYNIVELRYDNDILDDYDESVVFLGSTVDGNKVIETVCGINKDCLGIDITAEDILIKYLKEGNIGIEKLFEDVLCDYYDSLEDLMDDFSDIEDVVGGYSSEIFEAYEGDEFYSDICRQNGCAFGTAGYSPWSYYVSLLGENVNYINALYAGNCFYGLALLDEAGEEIDSVWGFYIPNEETLFDAVSDAFGLTQNNFYLVDNEESTYFDVPKIKKNEDISVSFSLE